jgi:4-hydroxy-3-methylbut-2-en-1-yl diphosphate reductase
LLIVARPRALAAFVASSYTRLMRVEVAKTAGFCWGVRRTVEKTFETLAAEAEAGKPPLVTLGPVIHNPQVLGRLEDQGVEIKAKIAEVADGSTVVVRTHGALKSELALAKDRGLKVVDGTCPYVRVPQAMVERMSRDGYHILIVGDEKHAEIKGVASFAEGPVTVMAPGAPVPDLPGVKKVGVVCQTTLQGEIFQKVVAECVLKFREVRAYNTICYDTDERQTATREIASGVDAVVVIGGRHSANTRHLAEISSELQPNTHHVETAEEIDAAWFAGCEVVGVSAGASTPDWVIDEVVKRLEGIQARPPHPGL